MYYPVKDIKNEYGEVIPRERVQNIVLALALVMKFWGSGIVFSDLIKERSYPTFLPDIEKRAVYEKHGLISACGLVHEDVFHVALSLRDRKKECERHLSNWFEDHWEKIEKRFGSASLKEQQEIVNAYRMECIAPKKMKLCDLEGVAQYREALRPVENLRVVRSDWVKTMKFPGLGM